MRDIYREQMEMFMQAQPPPLAFLNLITPKPFIRAETLARCAAQVTKSSVAKFFREG